MHRKPIFDLQCLGVSCGSRLDILDEGLGVRSDLPQQIRRVGTCATLPHQINPQFVYRFQLTVVEVLRKCLISGPKFPFDSLDSISIVSPDGISCISQSSFVLLLLLLLLELCDDGQDAANGPENTSHVADVFRHIHRSPRLELHAEKFPDIVDNLVALASPCSGCRA